MKYLPYSTIHTLFLGLLTLAAAGCQTLPVTPLPSGANPSEEIDKLQAEEQAAGAKQTDVLSPTHFEEAQEALASAKKSRDEGDKPEKTLEYVAKGRAYLKKALETADIARTTLGDAVVRREEAIKVEAPKFAQKSFDKIDADLKDATKKIEKNDTALAEKIRGKLADAYQKVKIEAIKEHELGPAVKEVEQAKKEDAKKYVPHTLDETTVILQETIAVIDKNPDNPAAWQEKSAGARAAAERLIKFTRDGKAIGGRNPEAVLLQREANEKKIAQKSEAVASLEKQNEEKKANIEALERDKQQSKSQQDFNDLFTKAQQMFSASEAEVFKQGDRLLLRLKGMDFAKGSAEIKPKNYELLNKVGQVAGGFGQSRITVEGHTDATGATAKNQQLSSKRAAAVVQYLISNAKIPADAIHAVGYGDQKPLASNKSPEGRAQNRRVDVIIEPQGKGSTQGQGN